MTIIQAVFLQYAFNAIGLVDNRQLTTVCLIFGIASLCLFLYNGIIWSIYAPFVTRIESKLRVKLFERILKFSYEHIEATAHGEWLTRLNTDVQMPFSQSIHLPHAVNAILQIGVSAVILWNMNPRMFGWVMLFVIPHIIIGQVFIARAMPGLNKKSLESTAENTSELTALITCADIAALYGGQDYLMKRFEQSSLRLLRAKMKIRNRNALSTAILPLFGMGGYLMLLIISGSWIADGYKIDEKTGYRYYNADQVQQLDALLELKQLGFSLSEIKKLLNGDMTNDKFMEALVHKKMAWQNVIFSAENKSHAIDSITKRMSTSEPVLKIHKLTEEERAWLLVKMVCVEDLHGQSILSEAIWL